MPIFKVQFPYFERFFDQSFYLHQGVRSKYNRWYHHSFTQLTLRSQTYPQTLLNFYIEENVFSFSLKQISTSICWLLSLVNLLARYLNELMTPIISPFVFTSTWCTTPTFPTTVIFFHSHSQLSSLRYGLNTLSLCIEAEQPTQPLTTLTHFSLPQTCLNPLFTWKHS